ncbi:recombinase family protein [Pseudarthrobacter sp. NPDC058119]|uniref:recombinase family protein n=1 Tax=Pseudarthrobacter sp. NPDC058119 TaxID=3346348 RepID=UPI0036D94FCA
MQIRAAIYTRISDDKAGEGLGVRRQEDDCRKLAKEHGFTVTEVFSDNDISAYSGKRRPGYQRLLKALASGVVDVVLCWHTDRLHRQPIELETYIQLCNTRAPVPVRTYAVKGGEVDLATPEGMLKAGLLGQIARYESQHKADRVRRAQEQMAASGKWLGGARPFGWHKPAGSWEREPAEGQAVADAFAAVLAGKSLGSIVRELNDSGILTSVGKRWGYAQLRQMLMRPRNAGLAEWKGEILATPSEFPALVSEDVWRAVCSILTDPSRRRSQSNKAVHLLAGIARCHCGEPVRSATVTGRNRESYKVYRCPAKGTGHVGKRVDFVDGVVNAWAAGWRDAAGVNDAHRAVAPDVAAEIAKLETEAAGLRRRLDDFAIQAVEGEITPGQMRTMTEHARKKIAAHESRMAELRLSAERPVWSGDGVPPMATRAAMDEWLALALDDRRDWMRQNLEVTLLPHGKGSTKVFNPATVRIWPKGYDLDKLATHERRRSFRQWIESLPSQVAS